MPELFFIYFLVLFILLPLALLFKLPFFVIKILLIVFAVIIIIPLIRTLFSAPFVPSKKDRVKNMLKLADLNKNKKVVELGCGDARILRQAAKKGVKSAVGYELSIALFFYTKILIFLQRNPARIYLKDIWKQDYSQVDVVFSYLLPMVMPKVKSKIWEQLKPGARFITNAFPLPEVTEDQKIDKVYLYIKK